MTGPSSQVIPQDPHSWRTAWDTVAQQVEAQAVAAEAAEHTVSARECYPRAVTYCWNASMGIRHTDPAFRAAVEKYRSLFVRFGELSTPAMRYVQIPYEDTTLPAFFLPADSTGEPRPTIVIGDNVSEELYYWVGPPARQRGCHALLVDLPGIGLNWMNGIHFRVDAEVGVAAAIDYLVSRTDVDAGAIVVYGGGEPDGYVMTRATAHEERIAARVVDPYVPDNRSIYEIAHRDDWANQTSRGESLGAVLTGQLEQFYAPAPGTHLTVTSSDADLITVPFLCLNDSSDPAALIQDAARMIAESAHPMSAHRIFTEHDGTSGYRELDNFGLKHRVMFDWLDDVITTDATPPASDIT